MSRVNNENIKSLEVFNLKGQYIKKVSNSSQISTSELHSGIYYLKVTSERGVTTSSFVIE